jgi:hypothetical protein
MRKVTIKGKEYKLAYNLRSLFIYEEIAGKPFEGKRTVESYVFMYAMLQANNDDFDMNFDELIDVCDEDFSIFQTFAEEVEAYTKKMASYAVENKKKEVTL